jgi:hypothetical protein
MEDDGGLMWWQQLGQLEELEAATSETQEQGDDRI